MNNLLPKQGEVYYLPGFLSAEESLGFYHRLLEEIEWLEKPIMIFGKKMMQPRLVAWHGDKDASYKYSGLKLTPKPWTSDLLDLKQRVEESCKSSFNSVLLNLYRNETDSNGWHADDEPELGDNPIIASLSFGETRDFLLKHKTQKDLKTKIPLENGSLLIMRGETQRFWKHCLPKRTRNLEPRINLTFRLIDPPT